MQNVVLHGEAIGNKAVHLYSLIHLYLKLVGFRETIMQEKRLKNVNRMYKNLQQKEMKYF